MKILRIGAIGLALLAVGAGTATSLMHVRLKLEMLDLGYLLGREARLERELLQAKERLRVELALLKSPARIGQVARGELGLVPAEPTQVYRVDPADPAATARLRAAEKEKLEQERALAAIKSKPASKSGAKSGKTASKAAGAKPAVKAAGAKPAVKAAVKPSAKTASAPAAPTAKPVSGKQVARAAIDDGRATP
jgi:hypothetical protein